MLQPSLKGTSFAFSLSLWSYPFCFNLICPLQKCGHKSGSLSLIDWQVSHGPIYDDRGSQLSSVSMHLAAEWPFRSYMANTLVVVLQLVCHRRLFTSYLGSITCEDNVKHTGTIRHRYHQASVSDVVQLFKRHRFLARCRLIGISFTGPGCDRQIV